MGIAILAIAVPSCTRRGDAPTPDLGAQPSTQPAPVDPVRALTYKVELPKAPPSEPSRPLDRCPGAPPPLPPAKVRAACDPTRSLEKVQIVHVSDIHGHVHPYLTGNRSPVAVLRAYVDRRRIESGGRVLFFDGGDDLEKGSLAELRSFGDSTIALIDHLGLDARTIGNHDFAYGEASVLRQSQTQAFDLLASNLKYLAPLGADVGAFKGKRTVVYEVGCARIGVFGLVINPYDETDDRVDAPYLGTFAQEHDPGDADRYVNVATQLVKELREDQKVDAVIAVNHLGAARDRVLLDHVPGLDLIITAHDHLSIPGHVQGKHGILVDVGSFLGAKTDAKVGEVGLEIDPRAHTAKMVSTSARLVDELRDVDQAVQAEAERLTTCFAPDADQVIGELVNPLASGSPEGWPPVLDAAIRRKFPEVAAIVYEKWTYGGLIKTEIPRGPVTPQMFADLAYSERQRAGGPGFTAFVGVDVSGAALKELCTSPLREPHWGQRIHRVCPALENVRDDGTYRLVIERRPLHAPWLAFTTPPKTFPKPAEVTTLPVEVMDLFIDYARARSKSCQAIDAEVTAPCR